jgi:hypothetical protein
MIKLYRIKYEVKQYILTSIKGVQYMNNDGILANLGISSKLAYGLIVQSILVIFSALISIWVFLEHIMVSLSIM